MVEAWRSFGELGSKALVFSYNVFAYLQSPHSLLSVMATCASHAELKQEPWAFSVSHFVKQGSASLASRPVTIGTVEPATFNSSGQYWKLNIQQTPFLSASPARMASNPPFPCRSRQASAGSPYILGDPFMFIDELKDQPNFLFTGT